MSNLEISKLLKNIATAYTIKNEKKYRFQIIAYQKASESIANLNGEVSDYFKEGSLELLPGIGPSIRSHLEELFEKGEVKRFNWVLKGIPKSVFVLTDIPTFGPKKAFRLVMEFKLENENTAINDLSTIAKQGKISHLEGFGEKSEKDILLSIEEFKAGKGKTTRMILPYAFETAEKVKNYLQKESAVKQVEALGSLRRRVSTVGDIDFAVATDNPSKVIEHFINYPFKERVIEKGEVSASILISGGKQIDLLVQPVEAFGSLLQHFTGSKNHNVHLREYALSKGLSLSEYGIKNTKTKNKVLKKYSSEKDFYEALGMKWIPPELREDNGEIELSIHSIFNMNRDEMTRRVLKGLSSKKAKILAHPTGRLLNNRNGYDLDFEIIFNYCKENNKALEINSWPQRLDLPDTLVKRAVEKGIKLVINSDSHAANQMELLKYGVFVARRGWATPNDILNTMTYNNVANWFNS